MNLSGAHTSLRAERPSGKAPMLFVPRLIALCCGCIGIWLTFHPMQAAKDPGHAQTTFWPCEYIKFK